MLFVSGSNDTLHYSDVFEGIELHHTLSNIDIPMQDGDLHVETSNYGGEVWSKAYFKWNAKGRFLNKRCQTLFILHIDGPETGLLKGTTTATEHENEISLYSEINNK